MKNNKDNIITNKAMPAEKQAVAHDNPSTCCDDPVFFAMRDNYHEFSMGLFTILECLKLAENRGYVPKISEDWWTEIAIRYHQDLHLL